ncbi:hypothetical protein [Nostoc sp. ChiQUE01b]|nr:hypothetical protein [Nostoc sp. ChiQUE01b]MDZ8258074.1 hypothetical protein [Nostoc sp. ChiQUE01b]
MVLASALVKKTLASFKSSVSNPSAAEIEKELVKLQVKLSENEDYVPQE